MKTIRDPVHGDIELSDAEKNVVDTAAMQRLRRIKQLSFCSLVYPGANHTRFEHSLGTMHLAGRIAHRLGIEEAPIRMAGLIHDAGHLPFSHSLETVFNISHEDNLDVVMKGPLGDAVNDGGFDKRKIIALAKGEGPGKIVSSQIDADRMDYLLRDSHYTGVAYGVIDVDRIINVIGFEDNQIFFNKKGIIALEALLIGRNQMYEAVYFHHTVRVADAMLKEAMKQVKCSVTEMLQMGDEEMEIWAKGKSALAKELLDALDNRKLYKIAGRLPPSMDAGLLAQKAKLKQHHLLISKVSLSRFDFSIPVKDESGLRDIKEVSKTARNLEDEIKRLECVEVCVPREAKERVAKILGG
jgi:HD superfamily phosphohydrolase